MLQVAVGLFRPRDKEPERLECAVDHNVCLGGLLRSLRHVSVRKHGLGNHAFRHDRKVFLEHVCVLNIGKLPGRHA